MMREFIIIAMIALPPLLPSPETAIAWGLNEVPANVTIEYSNGLELAYPIIPAAVCSCEQSPPVQFPQFDGLPALSSEPILYRLPDDGGRWRGYLTDKEAK